MTLQARLATDQYFDRPVQHTAQGDLYANIPFLHAAEHASEFEARGKRRRGGDVGDFSPIPRIAMGLVCSYTCGFMAQPPGTIGYGHPYRSVAPVVSFTEALEREDLSEDALSDLLRLGLMSGVMYLPHPTPETSDPDDWGSHAVAMLYRQSLVSQELLDSRPRVRIKRLSADAQRILITGLIQVVSPNVFDPFHSDLKDPDVSDSWAQPADLST